MSAFATNQDASFLGEVIKQSIESTEYQAELDVLNIGDDQTADKVILELVAPLQMTYSLNTAYKTGSGVCEILAILEVIRLQGESPVVNLLKTESSCK